MDRKTHQEQVKAPLNLFISYSRTDSAFVDRLEADLKARNFYVWVDRRKIEAGQDWSAELQKAIDRCQLMLVVLSPQAMESRFVRREYLYADSESKPIIPLNLQPTKVPFELNGIQWVNFEDNYDQGLANLLIALSRQALFVPPPKARGASTPITINEPVPVLVAPQPAAPLPAASLNELYQAGRAARAEGNPELAAVFWQQVLDRDPHFANDLLAPQMQNLMKELSPLRVYRLREQAEQAHRAGEWGLEIGAWEALLRLEPEDTQAKERIPVAQQNQEHAYLYVSAQDAAKVQNIAALKEKLMELWRKAPYYGDPAGLAKLVGVKVPPSFPEIRAAQGKRDASKTKAAQHKQQRKEFATIVIDEDASEVWLSFSVYLVMCGITVGLLTQSWPWAVGVVAALALTSYILGYRRGLGWMTMSVLLLMSTAIVFGITWFLATFQYDQVHVNLWFGATRTLTVRHQVIFGVILGTGLTGLTVYLRYFLKFWGWISKDDPRGQALTQVFESQFPIIQAGCLAISILLTWPIFMALGSTFNWSFGFGFGWAFSGIATFVALTGEASLTLITGPVIWAACTKSPEEIHQQALVKVSQKKPSDQSAENSETTGSTMQVSEEADEVPSAAPEIIQPLLEQGQTHLHNQQYEAALAAFEQTITLDRKSALAYRYKAEALLNLARFEEVLTACNKAIALNDYSAAIHTTRGQALHSLKRYEDAVNDFDIAIKLDSGLSVAVLGKAEALRALHRPKEALEVLERTSELHPTDSSIQIGKAEVLLELERYQSAEEVSDIAHRLDPTNTHASISKAEALIGLRHYAQAVRVYDELLQVDPRNVRAYCGRGEALIALQRFQEALGAFQEALRLNQTSVRARVGQGQALAILDVYPQALDAFERATALDPENVTHLLSRVQERLPVGTSLATLSEHARPVNAVAWHRTWTSDDVALMLASAGGAIVQLWEGYTGKPLATLDHTTEVMGVAWSPHGKYLASAGRDHIVRLWNIDTKKSFATLSGHTQEVLAVAWGPQIVPTGTKFPVSPLASAGSDRIIRLWDTDTKKLLATLRGHTDLIYSLAWSPHGHRLASASSDGTVRVWDADTKKLLATLNHVGWVISVVWSLDGERLASSGVADNLVRLWDATTFQLLATLDHTDMVSAVAMSPNRQRLASGGWGGKIRLWDATTGQLLATLDAQTKEVKALDWATNNRLASGSREGKIQIWKV